MKVNDNCDDVLVIAVSYDYVNYDANDEQCCIVVEWESDFSVMIRAMIQVCDAEALDKLCRDNWLKNNKG